MKPFTKAQEKLLIGLAIFGLVVPNGVFIYYLMASPAVLHAAFNNQVALVFIAEALFLMFLFAWLISHLRLRSPGWLVFVLMSLLGSMAFSIPAFLYMASRKARNGHPQPGDRNA